MTATSRFWFTLFSTSSVVASMLVSPCDAGRGRGPSARSPARPVGPSVRTVWPKPASRVVKPVHPTRPLSLHFLLAPPRNHVVLTLGGVTYYRHGYDYYRRSWRDGRWVYVLVAPPVGGTVVALPPSPERVVINGQVYYRDGATFYAPTTVPASTATPSPPPVEKPATAVTAGVVKTPQPQYVVTKPPVGALIDELPAEVSIVQSGGTTYLQAGGVHYLPITVAGKTKYVVVDKPRVP